LILTSNSDEERITTDKLEIEKALCNQNKKKFVSAYSSPFLQEPLTLQIGQTATSKFSQQILCGHCKPPVIISKATKVFTKQLCTPTAIRKQGKNDSKCNIETAISCLIIHFELEYFS